MAITLNGTTGIITPDLTSADDITANGSTVLTAATSPAALPLAGGTLTGNVNLGDNVKAIFGAGSDLQIWHAGDASYVGEIGTGNLVLFGDANVDIQNAAGQKTFRGESGGAANLFHANSVKLTTTATGINVTGTVAATAVTGDGSGLTGLAGTPTGALLYFAASTAPTGFIKANGASLSTTTYADLFAIVAYTYGGSGASFTLPDLRGEFMRGWDDARGVDSGRVFGSAQTDLFKSHNHSYNLYGNVPAVTSNIAASSGGYGGANTVTSTGGTETRPRNIALLACIKY